MSKRFLDYGRTIASVDNIEAIQAELANVKLDEIPTDAHHKDFIAPPTDRGLDKQGRKILATMIWSIDLESDEKEGKDDPATNSGEGVVSVGIFGVGQIDKDGPWVVLIRYEASFEYFDGAPLTSSSVKNTEFWCDKATGAPNESWQRLVKGQRPRRQVAAEICAMADYAKKLGWAIHIGARPAGYDFRYITGFFTTLGLKSPFGFGGAGDLTDFGQQIIAFQCAYGFPVTRFNNIMKNVIGRDNLTHGGLQDAIDQLITYLILKETIDNLENSAMHHGDGNEVIIKYDKKYYMLLCSMLSI